MIRKFLLVTNLILIDSKWLLLLFCFFENEKPSNDQWELRTRRNDFDREHETRSRLDIT